MNSFQLFEDLQLLVVDDSIDNLELITAIFELYNTQVISATSANKAFQLITQFKPDILISDIAMPNEDGYSLVRKIRTHKDEQVRKMPAVALTGLSDQESLSQAFDAGFTAYIIKPFNTEDLIITVSNLVLNTKMKSA